jgi:3-dehydroquinate synthetase
MNSYGLAEVIKYCITLDKELCYLLETIIDKARETLISGDIAGGISAQHMA